MLSCAPKAEALVDPGLIIDALKGGTPMVIAADEKAGVVTQEVLPQLIGNDNKLAALLGFTDSNDVTPGAHSVTYTSPYPVFVVDLVKPNSLQKLPVSLDLGIALIARETNWFRPSHPLPVRYLYPIQVDGVVVSSVLLAQDRDVSTQWNIHQIGYSKLIKQIYGIHPPGNHFLVLVPALNRYYLGVIEQKIGALVTFTITVIFNDPGINMHAGATLPAAEVFQRLKIEADKIDVNDPNYPPR